MSLVKFVFADAKVWRYVLRELAELVEVVGVRLSPKEGARIRAMDPSHVVMVDFHVPITAFEEFVVDQETVLFLSLEKVSKVLRRAAKADRLAMYSDGTKLSIALMSKGGVERVFAMPMIHASYEEIPELSLEFKAVAKLLGPPFSSALSLLKDVGEVLKIRVSRDVLSLTSSSELAEAEFTFSTTTGTLLELTLMDEESGFESAYSTEHVARIINVARLAETVTIKLAPEAPCEMDLELSGGAILKLFVAPRLE